jgi:dienelactone hydrolase
VTASTDIVDLWQGEPLGLWRGAVARVRTTGSTGGTVALREQAIEFSSRGDRVHGRLLLPPEGDGPFPVVVLQHGSGGSKSAPYIDQIGAPWAARGVALLCIDFPLHGERRSAKLTELMLAGRSPDASPTARTVRDDFAHQAVADLGRALDAVEAIPDLDADRIAYAGLSLGAIVGATFCARDPRPKAAALALGGAGFGASELDPAHHVGAFAPRPLLFVNGERDETVPPDAARRLHEAAGDPKEIHWFDGGHQEMPGRAVKQMWLFLARHLDVAGA